jgi:hypothetical protein
LPADSATIARVAEALKFTSGVDLCDDCLGAHIGLTPAQVDAAASRLANSPDFLRDEWRWGQCGARTRVTRARSRGVKAS